MKTKNTVRTFKRDRPVIPKIPMFRARLIYHGSGKGVVTKSKWYRSKAACAVDWLARGFVVIEDENIGGGFDCDYFPDVKIDEIMKEMREKYNFKPKFEKGETNE